jgi:nicotinamide mononucleotide (NMN) deamidase PncC
MATEFPPAVLRPLLAEIASLLKARRETISVVETAAGGLVSASLLSVPGASGYFKGGLTVCNCPQAIKNSRAIKLLC